MKTMQESGGKKLRFIFSGHLFCSVVTIGVAVVAAASILSRAILILQRAQVARKPLEKSVR
jgi:hypothetical protein